MRIARYYTCEFEFASEALLPKWKGNLLRGAIGYALKSLYCRFTSQKCEKCPLIFKCPFGYIYKSSSHGMVLRKLLHVTKPYTVKPPLEEKTVYKKGDVLRFSFVLFGNAVNYENHFINSLFFLSQNGIGHKEKRGRLILRKVYAVNPFRNKKEVIYEDGEFFSSKIFISQKDFEKKIEKNFFFNFLTPVRIVKKGALLENLTFDNLYPFMLRKYSYILACYCGINVQPYFEFKVSTVLQKLEPKCFIYKGEEQIFLYGKIYFSGKLKKDVRKVVNFCTLSHIGNKASHGFGWYEINSTKF